MYESPFSSNFSGDLLQLIINKINNITKTSMYLENQFNGNNINNYLVIFIIIIA